MGAKHLSLTSRFDCSRVLRLYNDAIRRITCVLQSSTNSELFYRTSESSSHPYTHGQILMTLVTLAQFEMSANSVSTFRDHLKEANQYIVHYKLKPSSATGLLEAAFIVYARCKHIFIN